VYSWENDIGKSWEKCRTNHGKNGSFELGSSNSMVELPRHGANYQKVPRLVPRA
jgi:hypothetical protein